MGYEILDHTADVCIRVAGRTFSEFLRTAALAMMDQIAGRDRVESIVEEIFEVTGETKEEILVRMLGEILYLHHADKLVFNDIQLDVSQEGGVRGVVSGEKIDPERHEVYLDIKAVTYHNLKIRRVNDKFMADIIFDI